MEDFSQIEKKIGYSFRNKQLLATALTHSSYLNESKGPAEDNERFEFFGDAIVEFCVSEYLFGAFKEYPEGALTKTRARLVCENGLAQCARDIDLGLALRMGKGEEKTGGRERDSIISDAFEALVAAIYLDGGLEEAKRFIDEHLLKYLRGKQLFFDAKTRLQEYVQKKPNQELKYEIVDEIGPVHERMFVAAAILNGKEIGRGQGRSKKDAQQQAAFDAIQSIK